MKVEQRDPAQDLITLIVRKKSADNCPNSHAHCIIPSRPNVFSKQNGWIMCRSSDIQERAIILIRIMYATVLRDIVLSRDNDPTSNGMVDGSRAPGI